jgi:hypothetical protein
MKEIKESLHIELLPSPSAVIRATSGVNEAELEKLVKLRVEEIMAERDALVFEPFFRSRQVAYELKRLQTVSEQRKYTVYYQRYGCWICGTQDRSHAGNGHCDKCRAMRFQRLAQIVAEGVQDKPARSARGASRAERRLPEVMPAGLPVRLHHTWQKRSTEEEKALYARVAQRLGVTVAHVREVARGGSTSKTVIAAIERDVVEQAHSITPYPKPPHKGWWRRDA